MTDLFFRGPFIVALGKTWCPEHFNCANGQCRRSLQDIGFVEEQGQLYCETCFEQYLAPICAKCSSRVKGVSMTMSWFKSDRDFVCRTVSSLWIVSGIRIVLLVATVKMLLATTASIWKTVSHTVRRIGTSFSRQSASLAASRSKVSLSDVLSTMSNSVSAAGDRWVEALNNNYHSQCFKCTVCQTNLEGQSFFAKGGRPFCKSHAR